LATNVNEAKLISKLSGRPAHVAGDTFVWNDELIDQATAIVILLKVNNQVPVGDSVKLRLHQAYINKFSSYLDDDQIDDNEHSPETAARVWFSALCRSVKRKDPLGKDVVKQILIDLHKN